MPRELMSLLVGAHFRPPAKQLLAQVPAGLPLRFHPEWGNPYDSCAIKVKLRVVDVPTSFDTSIEEALQGTGWSWADLREGIVDEEDFESDYIFLGYVAKTGGKPLQKDGRDLPGNLDFKLALGEPELAWAGLPLGKLSFGPNGEPQVILDLALLQQAKSAYFEYETK